ncbi:MAG: DMT family transporter [Candidatus Odinarchaeota archaeon]
MDAEKTGTIFILVGLFVYGIHPVVVEFGGILMAPLLFASTAALIAGAIALILALKANPSFIKQISRSDQLRLIMAGVLGTFLAFTCLFLGLQFTSSNNAAVILRAELAFALLFGFLFLGETISWRQAAAMILMIIGVLLVITTTQLTTIGIGDFLILITPIAWAAGHTFAKPALKRIAPWTVVAYRNLVGGVLLLLLTTGFILIGAPPILTPNIVVILSIILIEAIVILLAHSLWYAGISRINLGKATALIAPAPLVTFLISALVFRILPTPWQLIGAALVILATTLISREVSLRRTTEPETL